VRDDCQLFSIPPSRIDEIDAWLRDVRRLAPLAQITAYRLGRELSRGRSSSIRLTDEVQARMGPDPALWEEDLAHLYRSGLIAMWMAIGSPTTVMLLADARAHVARPEPG
jgi:hypothetical protein